MQALKGEATARGFVSQSVHMAMIGHGLHDLWRSHFGVNEHPFATYVEVHQGYRVLTHSHMLKRLFGLYVPLLALKGILQMKMFYIFPGWL